MFLHQDVYSVWYIVCFLHQGVFNGVWSFGRLLYVCRVFLHQGALSGVGCKDTWHVWCIVCPCIKVPLALSGAGTLCSVFCFCSLNQGALSGVGCVERISCHACCVFLHQGALSGVGWKDAWQVWCIVCSCTRVPLVVSCARTLCSVLYIVCFLHQGAFIGVGCVERILCAIRR